MLYTHIQRSRLGNGNQVTVSTDLDSVTYTTFKGKKITHVKILGYINRNEAGRFELQLWDWIVEELNLHDKFKTFDKQQLAISHCMTIEALLQRKRQENVISS